MCQQIKKPPSFDRGLWGRLSYRVSRHTCRRWLVSTLLYGNGFYTDAADICKQHRRLRRHTRVCLVQSQEPVILHDNFSRCTVGGQA